MHKLIVHQQAEMTINCIVAPLLVIRWKSQMQQRGQIRNLDTVMNNQAFYVLHFYSTSTTQGLFSTVPG